MIIAKPITKSLSKIQGIRACVSMCDDLQHRTITPISTKMILTRIKRHANAVIYCSPRLCTSVAQAKS